MEIQNCKKCGNKPFLTRYKDGANSDSKWYRIHCNCGEIGSLWANDEDCIYDWNRKNAVNRSITKYLTLPKTIADKVRDRAKYLKITQSNYIVFALEAFEDPDLDRQEFYARYMQRGVPK